MKQLKDNASFSDGLFVIRGNVKIYEGDELILDKDNAITNAFRKMVMNKLYVDITNNNAGLNTISEDVAYNPTNEYSYIDNIKFGVGSSASLGAKASKEDTTLVSPIPETMDDGNDLYINAKITRDLNILFDYANMKIQFTSDLTNNDSITYVLGELGVFSNNTMLTHLFFDPIYFEPETTKKIVYTIYLY